MVWCRKSIYFQCEAGFMLSLWIMLACLCGRAVAVFPMSWLCNGIKSVVSRYVPMERNHIISWRHQVRTSGAFYGLKVT